MNKTRQRANVAATHRPNRAAVRGQTQAFTLGRRAFAKVSAVEGIRVPSDMEAEFQKLDASERGARRQVLAEKYGKR